MPEYIALKTFLGRFGRMHRGVTYTLPQSYGRDLQSNGLVRPVVDRAPRNVAHEGAPNVVGEGTAGRPADGLEKPLFASPPARPLRKRTAATSKAEHG